jgi:hypothetical protein
MNVPAKMWIDEAQQSHLDQKTRLRLAAMAGHMQIDKIAARRAALIDLLADGRSHSREEIWSTVEAQLGDGCWGKLPHEALARDLAALRQGGIRIGYVRRAEIAGYYLQHPSLERPSPLAFESVSWPLIEQLRQLSVDDKNGRAFAAAQFALDQKKRLLAEEFPEWTVEQCEREARRLVYGQSEPQP